MLGIVLTAETADRSRARHLADQMRAAGARDVRTVSDLEGLAEAAEAATEPLLVAADDLVAHTAVLWHLATSPVGPTVALVLAPEEGNGEVRAERGRLVAGPPNAAFGGALKIGVDDLPALATAARGAIGRGFDAVPAALLGLGVTVFAHRVRLLVAARAGDAEQRARAEAAVAAVDSQAAELRLAVKERDDFFATYFVSTWSPWITRLAARLRLSPSAVTAISVVFAVVAAGLFAVGGRPALVAGAVLLYLGFVLDCVDGQLARYTRDFSAFGGWLDTMADRFKEYAVYAGLGLGMTRAGLGDGWTLAAAALTLQTVRHMTDTWYGALHDEAAGRAALSAGRLSALSERVQADQGSLAYWLKRTVVFPIGERWALMALAVALFDQRVALVAVLVWGGLAAAYTLALRTLRARSIQVPVMTTVDVTRYRDDGLPARFLGRRWLPPLIATVVAALVPVAALVWPGALDRLTIPLVAALVVLAAGLPAAAPHDEPLDWLVPAALRAAELLFVLAVGAAFDVPQPLTYALVTVLALHHYDLTARLEKRMPAPRWHRLRLGWDGRVLVLAAGAALGGAPVVMAAIAAYVVIVVAAGLAPARSVARTAGDPTDKVVFNKTSLSGRP